MQALSKVQSEFKRHSGLQAGLFTELDPIHKSHTANLSPYVSQYEFVSHGFGEHGCNVLLSGVIIIAVKNKNI